MNDDAVADLKQFITAAVAQATASLATREEMDQRFESMRVDMNQRFGSMNQRFDTLQAEMNQRFDDVDTKLTTIADAHAEQLADLDARTTRLEQLAA